MWVVGVKVTGVRNLSDMAPRQINRLRQGKRKRIKFSYYELWNPLQGVTETEFLISTQGLSHVTPNVGYLAN